MKIGFPIYLPTRQGFRCSAKKLTTAARADPGTFSQWLAPLCACEWIVYAKHPFAGLQAVLAYLARYTHRAAIANQRLLAMDERGVSFRYKDCHLKGQARDKTMTLGSAQPGAEPGVFCSRS